MNEPKYVEADEAALEKRIQHWRDCESKNAQANKEFDESRVKERQAHFIRRKPTPQEALDVLAELVARSK